MDADPPPPRRMLPPKRILLWLPELAGGIAARVRVGSVPAIRQAAHETRILLHRPHLGGAGGRGAPPCLARRRAHGRGGGAAGLPVRPAAPPRRDRFARLARLH